VTGSRADGEDTAVTEAEWLACTDPTPMLAFLRGKASGRKLRLFACACCRRIWHLLPDRRCGKAIEIAEKVADGKSGVRLLRAVEGAGARYYDHREDMPEERLGYFAGGAIFQLGQERLATDWIADAASGALSCRTLDAGGDQFAADEARQGERAAQCHLLREVFGNPFRPSPPLAPSVLAWSDRTVPRLAQAIYEERRLPEGALDTASLAVLADALLDAGCEDEGLIAHWRSVGPHVRGCWAVDLILGKS
jgi:hypothetical protein